MSSGQSKRGGDRKSSAAKRAKYGNATQKGAGGGIPGYFLPKSSDQCHMKAASVVKTALHAARNDLEAVKDAVLSASNR